MCEINVVSQVKNLCQTSVVQDAWARGQKLEIHSWVYQLSSGKLHCLEDPVKAGIPI